MSTDVEVVKWYTRARKFPQLIGRTPDGARLWGGPYTITQAVGGGLLLLVGINTMGLWARYGLLGNALLLLAVTYTAVLLLGRIPVGSRNPLAVLSGFATAVSSPRTGHHAGRPVRVRRPHRVRHRVVILQGSVPLPPSAAPAPAAVPTADPVAVAVPARTTAPVPEPAATTPAARSTPAAMSSGPVERLRRDRLRLPALRGHRHHRAAPASWQPAPQPVPQPLPAQRQPPALSAVQQLLAAAGAAPSGAALAEPSAAQAGSTRLEES